VSQTATLVNGKIGIADKSVTNDIVMTEKKIVDGVIKTEKSFVDSISKAEHCVNFGLRKADQVLGNTLNTTLTITELGILVHEEGLNIAFAVLSWKSVIDIETKIKF
jgi:hypothetical protein